MNLKLNYFQGLIKYSQTSNHKRTKVNHWMKVQPKTDIFQTSALLKI